jgi:hypothetical protein
MLDGSVNLLIIWWMTCLLIFGVAMLMTLWLHAHAAWSGAFTWDIDTHEEGGCV